LEFALQRIFSGRECDVFRERLRQRLKGGNAQEAKRLEETVRRLTRSSERLLSLLGDVDDEMLALQYKQVSAERRDAERLLAQHRQGAAELDHGAIERQLAIEPRSLLHSLFDDTLPAARVRALLARVFPEISLLGRTARFAVTYRLHIVPGILLAHATSSAVVDEIPNEILIEVRTSATRPTTWYVEESRHQ
jgi:hypothetical protein